MTRERECARVVAASAPSRSRLRFLPNLFLGPTNSQRYAQSVTSLARTIARQRTLAVDPQSGAFTRSADPVAM